MYLLKHHITLYLLPLLPSALLFDRLLLCVCNFKPFRARYLVLIADILYKFSFILTFIRISCTSLSYLIQLKFHSFEDFIPTSAYP